MFVWRKVQQLKAVWRRLPSWLRAAIHDRLDRLEARDPKARTRAEDRKAGR